MRCYFDGAGTPLQWKASDPMRVVLKLTKSGADALTISCNPLSHTSEEQMNKTSNEAEGELLNSYVTDMLALESHILTAIAGQVEGLDDNSGVRDALQSIHAMCASHVQALEEVTQRRAQNLAGVSKVVKKAVSSILGLGAAAVDLVRTEKLPKELRDDYAALSLAYIGNLMLHTSALSLGDNEISGIAKRSLSDHASAMMRLQRIIPAATVTLLREEGLDVDAAALQEVEETVESAWKQGDDGRDALGTDLPPMTRHR
jgi:hypothetical protein